MLQFKCRHSSALPVEACSFCNSGAPETLQDICLNYINANLCTICVECVDDDRDYKNNGKYVLREDVTLTVAISERLLEERSKGLSRITSKFFNIYRDGNATCLKRARFRNAIIENSDLEILKTHKLTELEITRCPRLTWPSVQSLVESSKGLVHLTLGDKMIFDGYNHRECAFPSTLRRLIMRSNMYEFTTEFYANLLRPLHALTCLDLSHCTHLGDFSCARHLINVRSLTLYNVPGISRMIGSVCDLVNLEHLDLSQMSDVNNGGRYKDPSGILERLVGCLPRLASLDLSGTNLAGRGVAEASNGMCSDIPGLGARVSKPFQYLGLYDTAHDACLRHDIPAKLIAGNANEEQMLVAAVAFLDRTDMVQKVLNELFHLLRYESCAYVGQALNVVLNAMSRHIAEKHVQISGSATLFYIVKSTIDKLGEAITVKRRIISALINGMSAHRNDETMMRNGCLTLCQFKIPADVVFDYERLVDILLHSVYGMQHERFVQRIGIYLLNSLACQVDGQQKEKLGELGAISKMIWLIKDRLTRNHCDDVLEVAWSTMWNVTDETPSNCRKFLEIQGMEHFLQCLEKFPNKEDLLRNMMGLLGNVAEVRELRHYLITTQYLAVFSQLLDSHSDGIEVSYNAAGVISHIASDGPEVWIVEEPTRNYVLNKMANAIDRWDINSQRNINYRSFEPILYLVKIYHTPACQKWAVWALANLTKVYPEKYCDLIESEGGLDLLHELIESPLPPFSVKNLASIVIENTKQFKFEPFPAPSRNRIGSVGSN